MFLIQLLLFMLSPVCAFATEEYKFATDYFRVEPFKDVNASIEGGYTWHPRILTQKYLPHEVTRSYVTSTVDEKITIDIGSDVSISAIYIYYHSYYHHRFGNIKLKSEFGESKTVTLHNHNGVHDLLTFKADWFWARYVTIDGYQGQADMELIQIYSSRFDMIRERLLSSEVVAAAYPFTNYNTLDSLHGFSLINPNPMVPTDSLDYIAFDDAPMAWFLVKLHTTSYITRYISSCFNHLPDTYLTYRYHYDRGFILYKENNQTKVFIHDLSNFEYAQHKLKYPFVASHIQIHMMFATPNFHSRLDFRGYFANSPEKIHNVIHLHTLENPMESSMLHIVLPKRLRVSGLRLHRVDVLAQFCLEYEKDGVVVTYKDSKSEHTTFLGSVSQDWILIKPIHTKEIYLKCLEWEEFAVVSSLVITLRGEEDTLATHRWTTSEKILADGIYKGFHVFPDPGSGISIFGNMRTFEKRRPDERLRSNFLGSDCLSRPWLCDKGFTVAFQIYGIPLLEETANEQYLINYHQISLFCNSHYKTSSWVHHSTNKHIGTYSSKEYIIIYSFKTQSFNCYMDIILAVFEVFVVNVPYIPVIVSAFLGTSKDDINKQIVTTSNWKKDFYYDGDAKIMKINMTEKFQQFYSRHYSLKTELYLAVGINPEINDDVIQMIHLDINKAGLVLKSRRKVPKRIEKKELTIDGKSKPEDHQIVLAGLETYLSQNGYLKIDGTNAQDSINGNAMFETSGLDGYNKERLYRPLKAPIVGKKFTIDGVTNHNDIYAFAGEIDYDSEEVLPIISCGIHGNDTINQGTGFSIFYTSKGLYGIVKTEEKQYTVNASLTHFKSDQWNSVVLRWTKDEITLDINDNPQNVGVSKDVNKTFSKPIFQNEYLLLFGQYHYQEAYSYGKFRRFYIWRYPIDIGQVAEFTTQRFEPFHFSSGKSYGTGFHTAPGCNSLNSVNLCDQEDNSNGISAENVYDVSKYYAQEVSEVNILKNTSVYWLNYDSESTYTFLQFDYVVGDFHQMIITEAFVTITLLELITEQFIYACIKRHTHHDLCVAFNTSTNNLKLTSLDMAPVLLHEIKQEKIEMKFYIRWPNVSLADASLFIKFRLNTTDQGLVSYAHEEEASVWNINYPLSTKCIYFTYKFKGLGFAFLSIHDVYGSVSLFAAVKIYLKENEGESVEVQYQAKENTNEIQIAVIKNKRGDGVLYVSAVKFLFDACARPVVEIKRFDKEESYQNILQKADFSLPHFIQLPFENYNMHDKRSINKLFRIHNYIHQPVKGDHMIYNIKMTTSASTLLFWLYTQYYGHIMFIRFTKDATPNLFRIHYEIDHILRFFFYIDHHRSELNFWLARGKWHFVQIHFNVNVVRISINGQEKEVKENGISHMNFHDKIYDFYVLKEYGLGLQLYHSYLSNMEIEQAKRFPTHVLEACPGESRTCAYCDQINGGWKLKESRKELTNINCTHTFQNFNIKILFTFDELINNTFRDIHQSKEIAFIGSNEMSHLENWVINSGLSFYGNRDYTLFEDTTCEEEKCFFSTWIQLRCTKSRDVLSTKAFRLRCVFETKVYFVLSTKTNGYTFEAKNGFKFHLAIEINHNTVLVYVDGTSLNLEANDELKYIENDANVTVTSDGSADFIIVDEFILNSENPFESSSLEALVGDYYLHTIQCHFVQGDGTGGTEINIHEKNSITECINACVHLRRTSDKTINGVTIPSKTTKDGKVTSCHCEKLMTGTNSNLSWKTCKLNLSKEKEESLKSKKPSYYVKFSFPYITWEPYFSMKGHYRRKEVFGSMIRWINYDYGITDIAFDWENFIVIESNHGCGKISIECLVYVSQRDLDLLSAKVEPHHGLCNVERLTKKSQYEKYMEPFETNSYTEKALEKHSLIFQWIGASLAMVPIQGLYITASNEQYNISVNNTVYDIDYINIDNLRGDKTYEVCISPIPLYDDIPDEYFNWCIGNKKTKEAEPVEKPELECSVISETVIQCIVSRIQNENFDGTPHGYQISTLLTENIENVHLDADEWNLTSFSNDTQRYNEGQEKYTFNITTDEIYKYYTIVAIATTQSGAGLGTRSNVTIRSHGGAPEKVPVLKSAKVLENLEVSIEWDGIGNNDETWNGENKIHWLYIVSMIRKTYKNFKDRKIIQYDVSYEFNTTRFYHNLNNSHDGYTIFQIYVTAKSEYGETNYNNSLCLLLDMEAARIYSSLLSVLNSINLPSINSVNISMSSFHATWWHGNRYYLVYAYYADEQSNYTKDDIITFVKNHDCDDGTHDYWLIKQCHYFNVSMDLEHYRKQGIPCNETEIKSIHLLNTSQSFLISGFHAFSNYTIYVFACNQLGCDLKNHAIKNITTDEYKPGSGPENITLRGLSSTSLKLSFGLIEPFYQHGNIQGYFMKLTCPSINISRYINETNDVAETEFDGLGKYENCCVIVAGFTKYPGLGNYSHPICNQTLEDIPAIAPEELKIIKTKIRSIEVEWKVLNKNEWNGEPLQYSLFCNCFLRNESMQDFQLNISVDNTKYKFEGLYPYTECEFSVAACTIAGCNVSKTINETTKEAVSIGCPANILLENRSSTCLNFTWNEIPIMQQNGIITKYEISLDGDVDSYVSTTSNTSISFCNLVKFHEYKVSIHGINSAGPGEICSFMNSTDEDVPCPPKNFTVDTYYSDYLIVEWENVPKHCRNGIITGFHIYYNEIDGDEIIGSVMVEFVVSKLRKAHLRKISAGSVYNVSMAALTSKGAGWKTEEITKRLGIRVDGNWTDWTDWSSCSASCGPAFTSRSRDCVNPVPENGGSNCTGENFQNKKCITDPCSGYVLAPPGQYDCNTFCTQLNMTCNEYLDTNFAIMLNDIKTKCNDNEDEKNWLLAKHPGVIKFGGEVKCIGYENIKNETVCDLENNPNEKQYQRICNCIHESDIGYGSWGEWSICSITCGDSKRSIRARKCYNGKCTGPSTQKGNCRVPKCPVDGNWGSWTGYEHCNKSCGYGYENRRRFCNNPTPRYGGRNCTGPSIDSKGACNVPLCPVHGKWGEWSSWSSCLRPCNSSVRVRYRECNKPAPAHKGKHCFGNSTETTPCYLKLCPNNWVHFDIMLKMPFTFELYYLHYAVTMAFSQRIKEITELISLNNTNILDVIVRLYSRGSVIVHFDVLFDHIDEEQLVHISDTMELTKRFLDIDIGWFTVNTTTVPCPPPQNIHIKVLNGGPVNISFDIEQCYDGNRPFQIYVFYIDNKKTSQLNTWKWTGIFANESSYIVVNDLIPMVTYRARLLSSSELGNGIPGDAVYFSSSVGPPLIYPPNLRHIAMSPTSIFIEWTDIPVNYRNGELLGYKVMYKQYFHANYMEKTISFGFKNTILEDLKPFTWYIILVCAFNRGGNGPTDYSVVQTLEGVPSIPVPNMVITDMQALDWWFVTWSRIPDEYVNGELIGYRLKYYLSYRSGQPIGGEKNKVKYDFDIYTFRHEERNLLSYATYNVTVTGFTKSGEGPTPEYYAKTCHCPEHLFGNWYINRPYTKYENNQLEGIFPQLIKDMIVEACGSCSLYKKTKLHYYTSKTPFNPNTQTEVELKRRISDEVDVSFPLYCRKEIQAIVPDSIFISMISSPGCAIVVRNETNVDAILNSMIISVVSVWPMLLVSYAIATLFGILVWFTDQFLNPDEFNVGSSLKGPVIGFWFSFVTMTTVGYGDITPRSFLAKTISMVWFLMGLVLNGIVVGFITSAVTSVNIVEERSLYNTLTGTVNNTFEQRYAVMRNAKSPSEVFKNIDDVLDSLSSSLVDAALIDIYSMASYKPILKEKQLKVVSLIDAQTGYGLALSGMAQVLQPDIESLVIEKQNIIGGFVSALESEIPDLSQEKAGSASADLFSANSPAFLSSCIYMGCIILGLSIIGIFYDLVRYVKRRMKVHNAATEYDNYSTFADDLLQFSTSTEDTINKLTANHTKEMITLVIYHRAYNRKVQLIGKWRTDDIVAASETKTGISDFSEIRKKIEKHPSV